MVACSVCGVAHSGEVHSFIYANEDQIHEEMKDPINHLPIYDPKDLPCGHTFSIASIRAYLREHGECPIDHKNFKESDLSNPSASLKRILDALKVERGDGRGVGLLGLLRGYSPYNDNYSNNNNNNYSKYVKNLLIVNRGCKRNSDN